MQSFNWIIEFDNGDQMGGGLKVKTFENARKYVQKVVDELKSLGYTTKEITIRQGKLVMKYYPES